MVRRWFWVSVGAGLGVWAVLRVQRAAAGLTPAGVVDEAWGHLRHLGLDMAAALADGRRAKRSVEADLSQAVLARSALDVVAVAGLPLPTQARTATPAGNLRASHGELDG